jgi:hypothetical protein
MTKDTPPTLQTSSQLMQAGRERGEVYSKIQKRLQHCVPECRVLYVQVGGIYSHQCALKG